MSAAEAKPTVVLDLDGTLVDSNYQHAIAWHRAFRDHGYRAAIWEIHRHVGMGGDQFVEALLGEEAENADGDELRDAHSEAFSKLIGEVEAIEGASELIAELDDAGATRDHRLLRRGGRVRSLRRAARRGGADRRGDDLRRRRATASPIPNWCGWRSRSSARAARR